MKLFLVIWTLFFACYTYAQDITIAASSNTQFALKELVEVFEKEHHIKVHLVTGSSGKLSTQIMNGAPYHLFLSANEHYANYIHNHNMSTALPVIYAKGTAVLWTTKDIDISRGLACLTNNQIKTIAIASPKSAPYGNLSIKALKDIHILEQIQKKIVYGNSISQVNQYLSLAVVDIGITSKSIVNHPSMKTIGKWVDIKGYSIQQAMVKLKHSEINATKNTEKFYTFLQSKTARAIFSKHGYIVN